MFGLFSRTKVNEWEIKLIKNILQKISIETYKVYVEQLDNGLVKGVNIDGDNVNFIFNSSVSLKYENSKIPHFYIEQVEIYDKTSLSYKPISIYFAENLICGYTLKDSKKIVPDVNNIKTDKSKVTIIQDSIAIKKLKFILSEEEIELVNLSIVESFDIEGKVYLKVKDLEDGDFIGIDESKKIYQINHNPVGVEILNKDLKTILK